MNPDDVQVPAWLPDTPEVRSDICDYYWEVQRFDREVGEIIEILETHGKLDNTIVVITSDNGMPFPRSKTNLYDSGCRMPMALRWGSKVKGGRKIDDFVSFTDFAPTFLDASGLKPTPAMTGRTLLPLLAGEKQPGRDHTFFERERHGNVRVGNLSYPARAIRTENFLYIRNFRPDRWPAGDPELWHSVGRYGDIDGSPTKDLLLTRRGDPEIAPFFKLACAKRPAEELYDLSTDPHQLKNVAGQAPYKEIQKKLNIELMTWMAETMDPRSNVDDDRYDHYRYFGRSVKGSKLRKK
jgi:arylsulfatase A-like enzyme